MNTDRDLAQRVRALEHGWLITHLLAQHAPSNYLYAVGARAAITRAAMPVACTDPMFRTAIQPLLEARRAPDLLDPRQQLRRQQNAWLASVTYLSRQEQLRFDGFARALRNESDAVERLLVSASSWARLSGGLSTLQQQIDASAHGESVVEQAWIVTKAELIDREGDRLVAAATMSMLLSEHGLFLEKYVVAEQLRVVLEHVVTHPELSCADAVVAASKLKAAHAWLPPITLSKADGKNTLVIADERIELPE